MVNDGIVDLKEIKLLNQGNVAEKAQKFFELVRNPYLFKVDGIVVHVEFGDGTSGSLQSHIQNLLSSMG